MSSQVTTRGLANSAVTDAKVAAGVDAAKIGGGAVSNTEFGYLDGVTSAIQTQFSGKEPTITTLPISKGGTNSGSALSNNRVIKSSGGAIVEAAAITANRALASDSNGIPVHTAVTDTELGYVSGVTSSIQSQINALTTATNGKETFVLSGTNITNGYVDLAQVAKTGSILFLADGWPSILEGASYGYTVSYTGGAGGKTRITWLNTLASGGDALIATDVLQINYQY